MESSGGIAMTNRIEELAVRIVGTILICILVPTIGIWELTKSMINKVRYVGK